MKVNLKKHYAYDVWSYQVSADLYSLDFSGMKNNKYLGECVECRMFFPYMKEVSVSFMFCFEITAMHD
jgi:hypothetical protein